MKKNTKTKSKCHKELILVLIFLFTLIGITYSWLRIELKGKKESTLKVGTLSLKLDDTMGNGINMENAYPITDEEGLETDSYTFTLTNDGTVDSFYSIYLDDIAIPFASKRMNDKYVSYALEKDYKEEGLVNATPTILTKTNTTEGRLLDNGVIKAGKTYTYKLRLWINKDANNDVMKTTFSSVLRVEAIQKSELIVQEITSNDTSVTIPYKISDDVKNVTCQAGIYDGNYTIEGVINNNSCVLEGLTKGQIYYYNITATMNNGLEVYQKDSFLFK